MASRFEERISDWDDDTLVVDHRARTASAPHVDVDAVASTLLACVPFIDVLAAARERRRERRDNTNEREGEA